MGAQATVIDLYIDASNMNINILYSNTLCVCIYSNTLSNVTLFPHYIWISFNFSIHIVKGRFNTHRGWIKHNT